MRTNNAKRHDDQIERDVEKSISKFSQHLMSNSKWIKLVDKFVQNTDKILKIEFKKVKNDKIGELYLDEDTTFGFDYWKNGFEGCNSLGGWLTFKEIEFIIFPGYNPHNLSACNHLYHKDCYSTCHKQFYHSV